MPMVWVGNVDAADRHPSVTGAAAHETFGGEQEKHDDGEDQTSVPPEDRPRHR